MYLLIVEEADLYCCMCPQPRDIFIMVLKEQLDSANGTFSLDFLKVKSVFITDFSIS